MLKRYMLAVSVILCALVIAVAQEKAAEQKPDKAKVKAQTGLVQSIDAAKNEIVIKDDAGAEIRLLVSSSTKITKAGKTIALADIKVGDKLSTDCEVSADGCTAKSIKVTGPSPGQ
jgi:hypothetical protein